MRRLAFDGCDVLEVNAGRTPFEAQDKQGPPLHKEKAQPVDSGRISGSKNIGEISWIVRKSGGRPGLWGGQRRRCGLLHR
jgi:hypothetical protein